MLLEIKKLYFIKSKLIITNGSMIEKNTKKLKMVILLVMVGMGMVDDGDNDNDCDIDKEGGDNDINV